MSLLRYCQTKPVSKNNNEYLYLARFKTMATSKIGDINHLSTLSERLWEFRNTHIYTDLTVFCKDGQCEIHKAMLCSVLHTAGVGLVELHDTGGLIVPGLLLSDLENALESLYLHFDSKPIEDLLCCFIQMTKLEKNDKVVSLPAYEAREEKEEYTEDVEYWDDNFNVTEVLDVAMAAEQKQVTSVKAEPQTGEQHVSSLHTQLSIKKRKKMREEKLSLLSKKSGRKKFKMQCPHCNMVVVGKKSYKKHLRNSHQMLMPRDGEEVQCQVCGKTLKHMQILKTHMKEVHGDRSFTCNLCGLTLSCQRNLNTHMISHTTPSIPCDQCGKLFKRKYAVKNHIKKFHMQIKEKMCDQCDKSFADARHLREHVLAIHDKLKPFGCEVCDFKCARIDNLNTHRKKSHGLSGKLTRAEHDEWVVQGKHPFVKVLIGGAEADAKKNF